MEILIGTMGNLREALDARGLDADCEIDGQNSSPSLSTSLDRTGRMRRARYIITETQIRMLREEGFRWVDGACILGVSPITLRRRRTESEMPVSDNFDDIPDNVLDNLVSGILHVTPQAGRHLVQGALRSGGFRIQRERIRESIVRVDPIIATLRNARRVVRRKYHVPSPNALW